MVEDEQPGEDQPADLPAPDAVPELEPVADRKPKRRRRTRAEAVVEPAAEQEPKRRRRARAEAVVEPAAEPDTSPAPVPIRQGPSPWLVGALVLLVLVLAAGLGFGAAMLVPGIADTDPPGATLPPPTQTPTLPPRPTPTPSQTPTPSPSPSPSPTQRIHVVARGENLTQIAKRYGVTVEAIIAANGIANPNLIEPGQRLIIPNP